MQKNDLTTARTRGEAANGAAARSVKTALRSGKALHDTGPAVSRPTGGTDRAQQLLADATHRFSARRLRDSLPGKLVTRRLVLRAPMRADIPDLVRLANNRAIAERLAILPHPYGPRDAAAFIEDFAQRPSQRPYAITLKEKFVGIVGFAFPADGAPELGYWLGEPFWGNGLMSEAAKALVDAAFATGHADTIIACALADNAASLAVLGKLGFQKVRDDVSVAPLSSGKPKILLELRRPKWM